MELFKNTNFDFLGKKWPFIIASLVLTVAGLASIADAGRAQVRDRFQGRRPDDGEVRRAAADREDPHGMESGKIKGEVTVQNFTDRRPQNEVEIGTELQDERQLTRTARPWKKSWRRRSASRAAASWISTTPASRRWRARLRDPLARAGVPMSEPQLQKLVADILNFRDTPPRSGLDHGFQSIVLRAGRECWYYEHSQAGVLSGAISP